MNKLIFLIVSLISLNSFGREYYEDMVEMRKARRAEIAMETAKNRRSRLEYRRNYRYYPQYQNVFIAPRGYFGYGCSTPPGDHRN